MSPLLNIATIFGLIALQRDIHFLIATNEDRTLTVINTNTAATITANALAKNERAMSQSMERLSTGLRINSAGDAAASDRRPPSLAREPRRTGAGARPLLRAAADPQ